jgi:hypothetical protein
MLSLFSRYYTKWLHFVKSLFCGVLTAQPASSHIAVSAWRSDTFTPGHCPRRKQGLMRVGRRTEIQAKIMQGVHSCTTYCGSMVLIIPQGLPSFDFAEYCLEVKIPFALVWILNPPFNC